MNILVTGANGQLGSELKLISSSFNFFFTDIEELDLSNLSDINLSKYKPNYIINCCAYTDVDNAENNYESANILNHESIKFIAKWTNENHCKLIHISTDYVYDGFSKIPLKEDAKTNPINTYGVTKLRGDNACLLYNPNSIILRTSRMYSRFGNNFVKKMIKLMKNSKQLNIISDQIGSPTYAADLADIILNNIIISKSWHPGIYNYTNEGSISWYDLAIDIKNIYGFDTKINSVKSNDYPTKAKRPKYSVLDNSKIKRMYDVIPIHYKDSLKKCIKILKHEE